MSSVYFDCIQCDSEFELSEKEKMRYAAKGFDFPRRCPDCRKYKNKATDNYHKHPNRKRDYRIKYGQETANHSRS